MSQARMRARRIGSALVLATATFAAIATMPGVAGAQPHDGTPRPAPVALTPVPLAPVALELLALQPTFAASATRGSVAANGANAFLLEALGGSVGSLVGIGLVGLTAACGVEDLACIIKKVGAAGALGVVGATVGTTLVARRTGSDRSATGAALGAIVGTGFALGTNWLLERANYELGRATIVPMVVLSQGTFAAAGSRLLGR